jgi:hypothetical protein
LSLTNEDYLKRWEESAPELVDTWTDEQITAARSIAPKEQTVDTYDKEMMGEFNDDALNAAIEEYSKRVSDAAPTQQTNEELCRIEEQNEHTAKEYQWLTPEEYANAGDRVGKVKGVATFITQLQRAGLNCWYRRHPHPDKLTLIIVNELSKEAEVGCWVQFGFMPELSVMRFDEHGVPTTEKYRGWRTCLLQIILKGRISREKAEEVFGKPPTTPAFHRYNRTLQSFRNQGNRLSK